MNKRFACTLWLVFIWAFSASAQVVNIEAERIKSGKEGWAGTLGLAFSISENGRQLITFNTNAHTQYKHKRHLALLLGESVFSRADGQNFNNQAFGHLRYNYKLNNWMRWEAFGQVQYNKVAGLESRILAGTGPRFKLVDTTFARVYLGTLYMAEWERSTEQVYLQQHRLDAYLSFTILPIKTIKITSTTYYQPRFDQFKDFRLSNDTELAFSILKWLAFTVRFRYMYDALPPGNGPNRIYSLTNGLRVSL